MKKTGLVKCFSVTALMVAVMFGVSSCSKDDGGSNGGGATTGDAKVSVKLTDGPADYDALWLDIQRIEFISDANVTTTRYPVRPGLYNLLELRNGIDTLLLSEAPVPVGSISQIRLLLGNNNSIVVKGKSYPLNTPSAQESGLKVNLHETLQPGVAYTFWLDFDAAKSIVVTGNGQYKLKPVIRAYTALTQGRISGYVLPLAALTTVYAIHGTDTFSAIPGPTGYYQLSGLPAGNYQLYYEAGASGYSNVTVNNVSVSFGTTIDLGVRTMLP